MEDKKTKEEKFTYFKTYLHIAGIFFLGFSVLITISAIMIIFLTKPAKDVRIPDLKGKRFVDVYNGLVRKGIRPEIRFRDVYYVEDGIILNQHPEKDRIVPENSTLSLIIARNELIVDVPNLIGIELPKAINKLKNIPYHDKSISLSLGIVSYIPSEKSAENIIIDQFPRSGSKVNPDQKVNLLISTGKKESDKKMPNLVGQSIDLSYDLLQALGLSINQTIVKTNDMSKSGQIVSQSIPKGAKITKASRINLNVYYYTLEEHPYNAYEKVIYKIPNNQKGGLFEAQIVDNRAKRIRFSQKMNPGQVIQFVFSRTGNAKVNIIRNKERIDIISFNVEDY